MLPMLYCATCRESVPVRPFLVPFHRLGVVFLNSIAPVIKMARVNCAMDHPARPFSGTTSLLSIVLRNDMPWYTSSQVAIVHGDPLFSSRLESARRPGLKERSSAWRVLRVAPAPSPQKDAINFGGTLDSIFRSEVQRK